MPDILDFSDPEFQFRRTVAVLKELRKGKHFKTKDGHRIGMSEDMSIGYISELFKDGQTVECISDMATIDLRELNHLLNEAEIWMVLPSD